MKTFSQISQEKREDRENLQENQANLLKNGFFHYEFASSRDFSKKMRENAGDFAQSCGNLQNFQEIAPKPLNLLGNFESSSKKSVNSSRISAKILENMHSLRDFREKTEFVAGNSKENASFPQITDFKAKFSQLKQELDGISSKIRGESAKTSEKPSKNASFSRKNEEIAEFFEENAGNSLKNEEIPGNLEEIVQEDSIFHEKPAQSSGNLKEIADFERKKLETEKLLLIHEIIEGILSEIAEKRAKTMEIPLEIRSFPANLEEKLASPSESDRKSSATEKSRPFLRKPEENSRNSLKLAGNAAEIAKNPGFVHENAYKSLTVADLKAKWLEKQGTSALKSAKLLENSAQSLRNLEKIALSAKEFPSEKNGESLKNVKELFEENQKILRNSSNCKEKLGLESISLKNFESCAEKPGEIVRCFSEEGFDNENFKSLKIVAEMKNSCFMRENLRNLEEKSRKSEKNQEDVQEIREKSRDSGKFEADYQENQEFLEIAGENMANAGEMQGIARENRDFFEIERESLEKSRKSEEIEGNCHETREFSGVCREKARILKKFQVFCEFLEIFKGFRAWS